MKSAKLTFIRNSVLCIFIIIAGFYFWLSGKYVVPIMMYHNVDYTDEFKPNTVSPANFERQMAYLNKHNFNVISFDDLVKKTLAREEIPRKSVVITFDDGYEDNYIHAYKVLKKYNFPATIFTATGLVGLKGHLSWEQMQEMIQHGITIGSHSDQHAYLPDLTPDKQMAEILGSKKNIEAKLGVSANYFSYPIGGFSDEIKELVKQAGYKGAAATNRGYDRLNKDVFELNRIRFGDRDVRNDYMWIKLSGYYNLFRKAKHPY